MSAMVKSLTGRLRWWTSSIWRWEAQWRGVQLEGTCLFQGRPILSVAAGGSVVIGNGAVIASGTRANVLGLFQPTVIRALVPGARVVVGPGVGMSGTILCAAAGIEVGEKTIFGAGAMVIDNDFHEPVGEWDWNHDRQTSARPVKIGRGAFIGARAIVLKGVTIGDRAVIGAGAVVTRDVPDYHVAVGNPARVFLPKTRAEANAGR